MWLNIKQAAEHLGYSASHFREIVRKGRVKSVRPTGRYRFRVEWLDEFMLGTGPRRVPQKTAKSMVRKLANGKYDFGL